MKLPKNDTGNSTRRTRTTRIAALAFALFAAAVVGGCGTRDAVSESTPAASSLRSRRHVSKLLRARRPELTIVVGDLGLHENVRNEREALLAAGASHVAATLIETRDQIVQAMHPYVKLSLTAATTA